MVEHNESDDDLREEMGESAALAAPVSKDRVERFYDRLRNSIRKSIENKSAIAGKTSEYLLLVPDVFILLWRLVNDKRVDAKNKMMLGSGLAYYFFPLDIMPDFVGPLGFIDDLVFGVYLLNKMLTDTEPEILREHWSGSDDVLNMIQNVLNAADNLVGSDIMSRFKKTAK